MAKKATGGTMKVVVLPLMEKAKEITIRRGATVAEALEKAGREGEDVSNLRINGREVKYTSVLKAGDMLVIAAPVSGGR